MWAMTRKDGERMEVRVKQIQGISFAGRGESNHWVVMDGPAQFGGSEAANRPMELLLIGLGGCTGSDVVSILAKKRAKLRNLELNIKAEQAPDYPKVFTEINIEYIFYGRDLKSQDLERAIELSMDKYCSAKAILEKTAAVSYTYKIIEED